MDLIESFQRTFQEHANNVAIQYQSETITYHDLQTMIEKYRNVIEQQTATGDRIAVTARRAPQTIALYLACLMSGRVYVPVDPQASRHLLERLLHACECRVHFSDGFTKPRVLEGAGHTSPPLDGTEDVCILHTSGSTGGPKAVRISKESLMFYSAWMSRAFPVHPGMRVACVSALNFDLCVFDIYVALASAAELHLFSDVECFVPQKTVNAINKKAIHSIYCVPTMLANMVDAAERYSAKMPTIERVMFAGEKLGKAHLDSALETFFNASFFNLYGPIETNVVTWKSIHRTSKYNPEDVGKAPPNVKLRCLTSTDQIETYGRGELLIAGQCVTPGYLSKELNSEKFLAWNGERYYKTGDVCVLSPEGVYLLGRTDSMIKIRGHRVELDAVESVVNTIKEVGSAAVVHAKTPRKDTLFCYVEGAETDELAATIFDACDRQLPKYAAPTRVVFLDVMPKTTTGKVDRALLKDMANSHE